MTEIEPLSAPQSILVIDDDSDIHEQVRKQAHSYNRKTNETAYFVYGASCAQEAVDRLDEILEGERSLFRILIDHNLRDEYGYDVYRRLLEHNEEVARDCSALFTSQEHYLTRIEFQQANVEHPKMFISKSILTAHYFFFERFLQGKIENYGEEI